MSDDDKVEGYDEIEATSDEDKMVRDPSVSSYSSSASTMRGHDSEDEVGCNFADSPTGVVVGSRAFPLTAI